MYNTILAQAVHFLHIGVRQVTLRGRLRLSPAEGNMEIRPLQTHQVGQDGPTANLCTGESQTEAYLRLPVCVDEQSVGKEQQV